MKTQIVDWVDHFLGSKLLYCHSSTNFLEWSLEGVGLRISSSLADPTLSTRFPSIQKFERLYCRTTISEQCQVLLMISCSSTPAWYSCVAQVLLPEWLVKFPTRPACPSVDSQDLITVSDTNYQRSPIKCTRVQEHQDKKHHIEVC